MKARVFVRCNVSPGVFSDEYEVSIDAKNGIISLFADKALVKDIEGSHYLAVSLINTENGAAKVLLPTEPMDEGVRWVSIPSASVKGACA